MPKRATTLWSPGAIPDAAMIAYTAGDDRLWDARLLRWDVLGSLGHIETLRASRLLTPREHARLRAGLRAALIEVDAGRLRVAPAQEDVHTAIEDWLTRRLPGIGERLHTGRAHSARTRRRPVPAAEDGRPACDRAPDRVSGSA